MRTPIITTPGEKSGYRNPSCYMHPVNDCSEKLSREHFISKTILDQFHGLRVAGMPWQKPGTAQTYTSDALASKVLCERHNNALSPIDQAAGKAFRAITEIVHHATKESLSERTAYAIASGDALEMWGVKTLLGIYHARIAQVDGARTADTHSIDMAGALRALQYGVDRPLGMYITLPTGAPIRDQIQVAPLVRADEPRVSGLRIVLRGLELDFLTDATGIDPHTLANSSNYRPTVIDFNGPKRTGRLVLTWRDRNPRRVALEIEQVRGPAPPSPLFP